MQPSRFRAVLRIVPKVGESGVGAVGGVGLGFEGRGGTDDVVVDVGWVTDGEELTGDATGGGETAVETELTTYPVVAFIGFVTEFVQRLVDGGFAVGEVD